MEKCYQIPTLPFPGVQVGAQGEKSSAEKWAGYGKENEKLCLTSSQELASEKTHFDGKFIFHSFPGFQRNA